MKSTSPRPVGIVVLTIFFYISTLISYAAALSLIEPGTALDALWRVNPVAKEGLEDVGVAAPILFFAVSLACALASVGLWGRRAWGRRVGVAVLAVDMLANFMNVFYRGDARALIGLPIAGILAAYLLSDRAKRGENPEPDSSEGEQTQTA